MPFSMRIQPLDLEAYGESEPIRPPVVKSRLKRLFDRKVEKYVAEPTSGAELEPSSVCLAKMVRNFIELESNGKQSTAVKCGRGRCNCFNGNSNGSSDDEFDEYFDSALVNSFTQANDLLTSLIPCTSVFERNVLADTSKIVEKNKICKRKDELRAIVTEGLLLLKYDTSICKSQWEKTPSYPAGEYEYIDIISEGGERVIIDVDFRSEFDVARPTGGYKSVLQSLPSIFVGKPDRLGQVIAIASEAAMQSLKKKGMNIAPWRKSEYVSAKWLSPHTRSTGTKPENERDELDFVFVENDLLPEKKIEEDFPAKCWELPEIKPKRSERSGTVVTGLAFLLREKP